LARAIGPWSNIIAARVQPMRSRKFSSSSSSNIHENEKRPGALEEGPGRSGWEEILLRVASYLRTAPGESPPLVEGPVPLSEVGPPAVPLGPP
jgi:hypothetical protein